MRLKLCLWIFLVTALTGCAAQDPDRPVSDAPGGGGDAAQPYAPQPGDSRLTRGSVYLDAVDVLVAESYPVQIFVALRGSLPTPCHQLRAQINPPDTENRIVIDVYSVAEPDAICVQMLQGFEANLALGSFPTGHYTVWVNGDQRGEFDS